MAGGDRGGPSPLMRALQDELHRLAHEAPVLAARAEDIDKLGQDGSRAIVVFSCVDPG